MGRIEEAEPPKGASPEPEHLQSIRDKNKAADDFAAKKALGKGGVKIPKTPEQEKAEKTKKAKKEFNQKDIHSETDLGDDPRVEENVEKGYPEKGIKGGTKAAAEEAEKRKKGDDNDDDKKKKLSPKQKKEMDVEPPPDGDGDIDAKDLAMKRAERKDEEEAEAKEIPTSDEIMSSFKSFEDILNSINFDDIVTDRGEDQEVEEVDGEEKEEE